MNEGSLDKQRVNLEFYGFENDSDINPSQYEVKTFLAKETKRRFGNDFYNFYMNKCKELYGS